uniref:Putative addiction module killer protein n=2 Tax=Candidatus Kentrum sp. FW TaxID=2126338 RepID=A0A450T494_9GAMM|nr:MAG: putative addiction module killer protein [Candidatus Kentron sp. FW]
MGRENYPRIPPEELYWFIVLERLQFSSSNDYNPIPRTRTVIILETITLSSMFTIKRMPQFDAWIDGLRDYRTRLRLLRRIDKARRGLLGDVASVGEGVYEMREFSGPGWRMYYVRKGKLLIVMLGGGDKSSQDNDIQAAKALAARLVE